MRHATKPAVLITDDDPGIRGLLKTVTLQAGCTADTAANGFEAIEKMLTGSYDLLLLDLMMPLMSGYDVIKQMKSMEHRPAVMVVTAIHDDEATSTLDGEVVTSILRKPFDVNAASDFIRVMASAVRNERAA